MSKPITRISSLNFAEAVEAIYAFKLKKAVAIRTRNLILPLGSLVFALHALLIALGGLYALMSQEEALALETLTFIPTYWNGVMDVFRSITDLWYVHALLMVVYVFLVPFAVSGVLALIVRLTTHVKQPTLSGNVPEQAKQLYDYTNTFPRADKDDEDAHKLWRRLAGATFVVGLLAFVVYASIVLSNTEGSAMEDSALYILIEGIVGILIACAVIHWICTLLHRLFALTIRPFYTAADQKNDYSKLARAYWVSVDPEEQRKAKEAAKKAKERRPAAPSATSSYSGYSGYSGSYSSAGKPMSRAEMQSYIDQNCRGMFSYSGIETIENDSNLTASQKEDLKRHLMIWGD